MFLKSKGPLPGLASFGLLDRPVEWSDFWQDAFHINVSEDE